VCRPKLFGEFQAGIVYVNREHLVRSGARGPDDCGHPDPACTDHHDVLAEGALAGEHH
jgi:hypothetical protein